MHSAAVIKSVISLSRPPLPRIAINLFRKLHPYILAKTVSSSRRQCKLLGWIMSVSFGGVYQRGSITHGPKSEIGRQQHLFLSTAGSWCAATAQDTRWCPVTLRHGNTGSCKTPGRVDTGTRCEATKETQKQPVTVRGWFFSFISLICCFVNKM